MLLTLDTELRLMSHVNPNVNESVAVLGAILSAKDAGFFPLHSDEAGSSFLSRLHRHILRHYPVSYITQVAALHSLMASFSLSPLLCPNPLPPLFLFLLHRQTTRCVLKSAAVVHGESALNTEPTHSNDVAALWLSRLATRGRTISRNRFVPFVAPRSNCNVFTPDLKCLSIETL